MFSRTRLVCVNLVNKSKLFYNKPEWTLPRHYAKKPKDDCRRAIVDIPKEPMDDVCTEPCVRRKKKDSILYKIKLKVIEGGTNFGTPFRRLQCKETVDDPKPTKKVTKALPPPEKKDTKDTPVPQPRPGMQVAILGADTAIGQYVALLLKQCSCIKKLRLYEAADNRGCERNLYQVVQDLQHINTNCHVQAYSCACCDLERCLQNSDIVLILESSYVNVDMSLDKRFQYQAPIVKRYADVISNECPKAFIIVCATPIDCMVPLIAQTLKETGWYNRNKLLGSLAVPEMRASTLAARALGLEPRYTRVPCVGGTEGESLVPLFSRAVEYFDFAQKNALMMTNAVRTAQKAVARIEEDSCARAADLSEAHALAGLVKKVAHALLCMDMPRITGFVETDPKQIISPARYIANQVDLSGTGIIHNLGLPRMSDMETSMMNLALIELNGKQKLVEDCPYMAREVLLCGKGICQHLDLPPGLTDYELNIFEVAYHHVYSHIKIAEEWHKELVNDASYRSRNSIKKNFNIPRFTTRLLDCAQTTLDR